MSARRPPCAKCFECQVCVTCETFARPVARQPEPRQPPMPMPRQYPLDEQRIRQIVLEILIELGLIPEARKRAKITPSR